MADLHLRDIIVARGSSNQIAVNHSEWPAIQYDLYIPAAIWDSPPVRKMLDRLRTVNEGATVLSDLKGLWKGNEEQTNIYRVILPIGDTDRDRVRAAFQNEVANLMAELSVTKLSQQAFLFTETEIRMNLLKM